MPQNISKLTILQNLDISNNKINSLSEVASLPFLKYLNAADNDLEELPDSFAHLKYLRFLKLSDNLFKELPPVIEKLDSLVMLDVRRNYLTSFSPKIIKRCILNEMDEGSRQISPKEALKTQHSPDTFPKKNRL